MTARAPRVGIVSLGCAKALVDSERILTQLRCEGYDLVGGYDEADLVVVNTCGFIDDAVAESLDAIGEALAENGRVVVTGCLGARAEQVRERYPEVLAVTGPHQYQAVMDAVHRHLPAAHDPYLDLVPPQGLRLTPRHYAYLKISEGCNHSCTFCIIPSLRGRLASRAPLDVLAEAERLVESGVRELLVISQDTSAWGLDLKGCAPALWRARAVRPRIADLAAALGDLGAWVRLHYVYPYPHVDGLVELMAAGRVLPYLDVPFQHGSPAVLRAMRRPAAAEDTLARIRRWRDLCPQLTLRSTFIVGFPGETDDDFRQLIDFVRAAGIDRAGCFRYSAVDGAAANQLAAPVPEEVKAEREEELMEVQAEISAARLATRVGRRMTVLVDECDGDTAVARGPGDAPEVDGLVHIEDGGDLEPGEFAEVMIERADTHDLWARCAER